MVDLHRRVVPGKALFRLIGTCGLILFAFWNPLVLRPRYWSLSVFLGVLAIDAALLVGAVGLLFLRKWAALLLIAVSGYVAFVFSRDGYAAATVFLVLPLVISAVFWRDLVWGKVRRDSLFAVVGIVAAGLVVYLAYLIRLR